MAALISIAITEVLFWVVFASLYYYLTTEVEEFKLERIWVLWLLGFVPVMILIYFYLRNWKNKAIVNYADHRLLPHIFHGVSTFKALTKFILLRLGLSFIIIAMANPQYGKDKKEVASKGIDIMIAIDVSNSMLAEDLTDGYSRLKISKLAVEQLISKLHGDHIGIVVFAGNAYKHLPITPDYQVAKMFLDNITTQMMSSQGTDIGYALEVCMSSFDFENGANKTIIVFTDGEDHEQKGIEIAEQINEEGVIVHTIGMGTSQGVPIPVYRNGKKIGVKKDQNGNTVLTKLNVENLVNIASSGGGSYTQANGLSVGLDGLLDSINKIEKKTLSKDDYLGYDDKFQIYLLIGLLMILAEMFINEKRSKLLEKLNLFE